MLIIKLRAENIASASKQYEDEVLSAKSSHEVISYGTDIIIYRIDLTKLNKNLPHP